MCSSPTAGRVCPSPTPSAVASCLRTRGPFRLENARFSGPASRSRLQEARPATSPHQPVPFTSGRSLLWELAQDKGSSPGPRARTLSWGRGGLSGRSQQHAGPSCTHKQPPTRRQLSAPHPPSPRPTSSPTPAAEATFLPKTCCADEDLPPSIFPCLFFPPLHIFACLGLAEGFKHIFIKYLNQSLSSLLIATPAC